MARCWEGEHIEAKLLVELDELRGGRLLTLTQNAAHCTAALLRGYLERKNRGVSTRQRKEALRTLATWVLCQLRSGRTMSSNMPQPQIP